MDAEQKDRILYSLGGMLISAIMSGVEGVGELYHSFVSQYLCEIEEAEEFMTKRQIRDFNGQCKRIARIVESPLTLLSECNRDSTRLFL